MFKLLLFVISLTVSHAHAEDPAEDAPSKNTPAVSPITGSEATPAPTTTAFPVTPVAAEPATKPQPEPQPKAEMQGEVAGHVTQIFREKNKIVMTVDPSLKRAIPKTLVYTNPKGEACEGSVVDRQADKVFVDFGDCSGFTQIAAGASLTVSLFQSSASTSTPDATAIVEPVDNSSILDHVRFSISVGYSMASDMRFDSATFTTASGTNQGSETFDVQNALEIAFQAMSARPHNWGFIGGLTLEEKRNIKGGSVKPDGGTSTDYTFTSPYPTMQFSVIEVSALYRWGSLFLPFGINYSIPTFTKAAGSTGTFTATGSTGGQIGIGYIADEHWHMELYSQALGATAKITSSTGSADLGYGSLSSLVLRVGYCF